MFKPHRDYLLRVARELEVTEMLRPEVERDVRVAQLAPGAPPRPAADLSRRQVRNRMAQKFERRQQQQYERRDPSLRTALKTGAPSGKVSINHLIAARGDVAAFDL
jgi:hypothetical protein